MSYRVIVTDYLLPALVGQAGSHYESPPTKTATPARSPDSSSGSQRSPTDPDRGSERYPAAGAPSG